LLKSAGSHNLRQQKQTRCGKKERPNEKDEKIRHRKEEAERKAGRQASRLQPLLARGPTQNPGAGNFIQRNAGSNAKIVEKKTTEERKGRKRKRCGETRHHMSRRNTSTHLKRGLKLRVHSKRQING